MRVTEPLGELTLWANTGTIVRPEDNEGSYIVRLDRPALYHSADGREEELWAIRETANNLELLPEPSEPRQTGDR